MSMCSFRCQIKQGLVSERYVFVNDRNPRDVLVLRGSNIEFAVN